MRSLAHRADLDFGSAAQSTYLADRPYERLLRRNAAVITFENEAKWRLIHPQPDRYDFGPADRLAAWAWRRGMRMRGHTLAWHVQNPDWLKQLQPSRPEAIEILRKHIFRVVGHFRRRFPGLVTDWDVVNEPIDNDGTRRSNLWQRWIGDRYVDYAFRFARRAGGPKVELYLNDYFDDAMMAGSEAIGGEFDDGDPVPMPTPGASGPLGCEAVVKCAATRALVLGLRERSVPIDGVGFQGHMLSAVPSDYRALTRWVGELGLQWAITEADRPIPAGAPGPAREAQAQAFATALRSCVADPACDTYVLWNLADRYTWWRELSSGLLPDALPWDEELQPKPAVGALGAELAAARRRPACHLRSARIAIPRRFGEVRRARAIVVGTGLSRAASGRRAELLVPLRGVRGRSVQIRLTLRLRRESAVKRLARTVHCQ